MEDSAEDIERGFMMAAVMEKLLQKRLLTAEEQQLLDKWSSEAGSAEQIQEATNRKLAASQVRQLLQVDFRSMSESIKQRILTEQQVAFEPEQAAARIVATPYKWLLASAALVAVCFFLYHYLSDKSPAGEQAPSALADTVLKPGSDKAMLLLADGRSVSLGQGHEQMKQGSTRIEEKDSGLLTYNSAPLAASELPLYNKVITPRGGRYQIVLSDGTRVWLNSESSITFPVRFSGTGREVSTTGEVFFEVAKNKHFPFRVKSGGQIIQVLGTAFNVNAFDSARIITTLIQGKIQLAANGVVKMLQPGQQSQTGTAGLVLTAHPDIELATAWKNGEFYFNDASIEDIMEDAARWYDATIRYQGRRKAGHFNGKIPRDVSLDYFLELLSLTGHIHFKVEGKVITVFYK